MDTEDRSGWRPLPPEEIHEWAEGIRRQRLQEQRTAADQAEALAIAAYRVDPIEMEYREAAAREIERLGWVKGNWQRPSGEICVKQALIIVCRHAPLAIFDSVIWHLEREIGEDLETFNDASERTEAEVLAALRGTS